MNWLRQRSGDIWRHLRTVFASFAFRFIVRYVVGLGFSVFCVMVALYASYSYRYYVENEQMLTARLDSFAAQFARDGRLDAVDLHADLPGSSDLHYLLLDAAGRKVAGDLDHWPQHLLRSWLQLKRHTSFFGNADDAALMLGKSRTLPGGYHLLVVRNYGEILLIESVISGVMVRSVIVTVLLGAIGGIVVASRGVRNVGNINSAITRIISGDLSERIPVANSRGDFRVLAMHFNQLLDRIQALMEGMRQVTDNVAHDLRTPLTRIRNHLASLQQDVDGELRDTVQTLLGEADSLLATFNALLRIAQVESGQRRSGFRCIDLGVILSDLVELYEPLALDKDQSLVAAVAERLEIPGDRDLLFQAFANLLDNAIKYTPAGGEIRVRAWREVGGSVVVELSDTGEGVPEADRSRVFRRFYRVEASRSAQPGNGLGLSLVKAVIDLHRGSITLGEGAPGLVVQVRLPGGRAPV